MPDPILTVTAIALASGAAGGAAGKLVERGVDAGVDWIRAHLSKHGHAIQERAERNAAEFLIELATRVSRIEKELARADANGASVDERLSSPDFAATMQTALIAASRTSDSDRHKLLAAAVSDRLRHADEDPQAIAANTAVEVIPRLSKDQLAFLGLRHGVATLKYPRKSPDPNPARSLEERVVTLRQRFMGVGRLDSADYLHLASVSCAIHGGGAIVWSLQQLLADHYWPQWDPFQHLQKFPDGQWLIEIWKQGAEKITLTLVGATIASHVYYLQFSH